MKKFFLIMTVVLLGSCSTNNEPSLKISSPDHKVHNIAGWKVYFGNSLQENEQLFKEGIEEVSFQLTAITRMLSEERLAELRKVKIWVEEKPVKGQEVNAAYHPSRKWLEENGVNPLKAKSVEIPDLEIFIEWSREANTIILMHELFHAYHHQVLGFEEPTILKAFKKAEKDGKYSKVLYFRGSYKKHYAISNHQEYFAEASEAYLATNDYFPFVRAELKTFDPEIYRIVEKIWGKK